MKIIVSYFLAASTVVGSVWQKGDFIRCHFDPGRGGLEIRTSTNLINWTPLLIAPPGQSNFTFAINGSCRFFQAVPGCQFPDEGVAFWVSDGMSHEVYERIDIDGTRRGYEVTGEYHETKECFVRFDSTNWNGTGRSGCVLRRDGPAGAVLEWRKWGHIPFIISTFHPPPPEYCNVSHRSNYVARSAQLIASDYFSREVSTVVWMRVPGAANSCESRSYVLGITADAMTTIANESTWDFDHPFDANYLQCFNHRPDAVNGETGDFRVTLPAHSVVNVTPAVPWNCWIMESFWLIQDF